MPSARATLPQERRAAPRPSPVSGLFLSLLRASGLPEPALEVEFAPPRKFRADFCWPSLKLIVECNGGIWRKSGHSSGRGLLRDYEKANLAQKLGWRYLVYTPDQLTDGTAIADLREVLK